MALHRLKPKVPTNGLVNAPAIHASLPSPLHFTSYQRSPGSALRTASSETQSTSRFRGRDSGLCRHYNRPERNHGDGAILQRYPDHSHTNNLDFRVGRNQSIQVKNTQANLVSNGSSFFVQIPTTLVRSPDYGNNGLGAINVITNGSVINIYGGTELTNQCGVYENTGYQLVDQRSSAQYIYGNYNLQEQFSNYSSTVQGQTVPATQNNPIVISQVVLGDTQWYGSTPRVAQELTRMNSSTNRSQL